MKAKNKTITLLLTAVITLLITTSISAHCDSIEGPVVKAAKKAFETGNLNYVLIWVKPEYEEEIKTLFDKANRVKSLSPEAKELAEVYFFETLVRLHRAGEGFGYTGLKPAGYKPEKGIEDADMAITSGSAENLLNHINKKQHAKVKQLFADLQARKNFDINNVTAGRKYVESYVGFIHYIEELFGGEIHNDKKHAH